jgi:hypothetical protein
MKRALLALIPGLLLVAPSLSAHAAGSPQDIILSPSSIELSAPSGGSDHGTVSVVNSGAASFNVKVYPDAYHVSGLEYDPSFTPLPGKTDPSHWVKLTGPTTATVAPGMNANFAYTLNVPPNTVPGGYYAILFAETQPPTGQGVTSHSRVGNILYITVQGNVVQSGTLNKRASTSPLIFGDTVPLSAQIENSGGLHFITTVNIRLVNPITNKTTYLASLQRYVLPQTTRQIAVTATSKVPIGLYKVETSALILGKVQTLPTSWVLVIHPIVLLVLPIIIALAVLYFRLPRRRRRSEPQPPAESLED